LIDIFDYDPILWAGNLPGQRYDDATFLGEVDDGLVVTLTFTVSADEQGLLGSRGTCNLALQPITTYEAPNRDAGELDMALTPSGTDQQVIDDTATEYLTLTGSVLDVPGASSDSATETLKLTPIGLDDPQYGLVETGTEYLDLQPSGVDVFGYAPDSGTGLLKLTPDAHECFNHPTPQWEFAVSERWQIQDVVTRWDITDLRSRWHAFVIDVGLDNSC
jgi:hypothetical protein